MQVAPAIIMVTAPLVRAASMAARGPDGTVAERGGSAAGPIQARMIAPGITMAITMADGPQPTRRALLPKRLRAQHTTLTIPTSFIAAISRRGSGTGLTIRGDWSASAEPHARSLRSLD